MQVPVFGQNPALAAAQPAPVTLAAAKPALAALPAEDPPVLPTSAPAVPVPPTDPAARAPMGFLEMARQIQHHQEEGARTAPGHGPGLFGEDGFDFDDVLDIINPLQHIPIVSTLYRAVTGDTIAAGPRLAGGALFGGALGFMSAAVNAAIEEQTGHDIGDHVRMALLGEPEEAEQESVMFASADTASGGEAAGEAAALETMTASPEVPGSGHKLTPEQIAILNSYDGHGEEAAAVMPAAGPGAPPNGARELSPEQEELLLRSLGLSPEEAKKPGAPAPEPTGDAEPDADVTAGDEPAASAAPPTPVNVEPLPRGPAADPGFAQRMKHGLERYFAQPTPHNPDPPRVDQRW